MPLQKRPVTGLDDPNHKRRDRETINQILDHSFDDSRVQTKREKLAGVTPVNPAYEPGHVFRYGAKGDGVTDDTLAIQNAIDAAGESGEVIFPAIGVFLCAGSLTGLDFQTWRGATYELGAGTAQASLKCSKTSGTFITAGANCRFENIRFLGVISYTDATGATANSTCIAISLPNSVTLKDVSFELQYICLRTSAAYYARIYGGDVSRCGQFVLMMDNEVYDFHIDGTNFRLCNVVTGSDDTPIRRVQNLKMMGGSVEGFTAAFNSIRVASFFGTYFENQVHAGAFGFNSDASFNDEVSITIVGCLIFINNLDRFVNYSGLDGGTFVSIGNTIGAHQNTGENQYYFVPQNAGTGRTVMIGDYLDDRGTGTFQGTYVSATANLNNQLIIWPRGTTADHANAGQQWVDGTIIHPFVTLANSATPSVKGGTNFVTGGTTTITNFADGTNGQTIRVIAEHTITITDGSNIQLAGSVNWTMNSTDVLTLTRKGGQWFEISRSDNS